MIVACDPGISGALALWDWTTGRLDVTRMPTQTRQIAGRKLRTVIDEGEVLSSFQAFAAMGATHLFIEAVGGLPGQSAPAAFSFGQGYGTVRVAALAAGMAIEAIPPAVWKQALKVPRDKHAARQRASEMIPTHRHLWPLAKDDGIAEAALLALYGEKWIKGAFTQRTPEQQNDVDAAARAREAAAAEKRDRVAALKARQA